MATTPTKDTLSPAMRNLLIEARDLVLGLLVALLDQVLHIRVVVGGGGF